MSPKNKQISGENKEKQTFIKKSWIHPALSAPYSQKDKKKDT